MWHVFQITGQTEFRDAARQRIEQVLSWQSDEGWFDEYGGADPGYQTLTLKVAGVAANRRWLWFK